MVDGASVSPSPLYVARERQRPERASPHWLVRRSVRESQRATSANGQAGTPRPGTAYVTRRTTTIWKEHDHAAALSARLLRPPGCTIAVAGRRRNRARIRRPGDAGRAGRRRLPHGGSP